MKVSESLRNYLHTVSACLDTIITYIDAGVRIVEEVSAYLDTTITYIDEGFRIVEEVSACLDTIKYNTYIDEGVRVVEEVSAGLDNADEGNDEEGHQLHHGPDLAYPAGQVDVSGVDRPVKHLTDVARLEGDHGHDQQRDWQHLDRQIVR